MILTAFDISNNVDRGSRGRLKCYEEVISPQFTVRSQEKEQESTLVIEESSLLTKIKEGSTTTFEKSLRDNYDKRKVDDKCTTQTLEYIMNTESVADETILMIKLVTKVGYRILQTNPDLPVEYILKLYNFSMEGVKKIENKFPDYVKNLETTIIGPHLVTYAADFAKAMFEKTKDYKWAEEWYDLKILGGKKCADLEPSKAAHSYSMAGEVAEVIFIKTGDPAWLEKSSSAYTLSAIMSEDSNPKHSAHCYSIAGDKAQQLFDIGNDYYWAHEWYDSRRLSAEISMKYNQRHAAHSYTYAGNAATILFYKTKDTYWAEEAIDCYERFLEYYKLNPDPEKDGLITRIESKISAIKEKASSYLDRAA